MKSPVPYDVHAKVIFASPDSARRLLAGAGVSVIHWHVEVDGACVAECLLTETAVKRIRAARATVQPLGKVNGPADLKKQVSQGNRYAARLRALRRESKRP